MFTDRVEESRFEMGHQGVQGIGKETVRLRP